MVTTLISNTQLIYSHSHGPINLRQE